MSNRAVFGLYAAAVQLESGVDALRQEGFRSEDISVLFADNEGTKDFALQKGTKAPEGATTGAFPGWLSAARWGGW